MKRFAALAACVCIGILAWVVFREHAKPAYGQDGVSVGNYTVLASVQPGEEEGTYKVSAKFYRTTEQADAPVVICTPTVLIDAGENVVISNDDDDRRLVLEVVKPEKADHALIQATVEEGGQVVFGDSWKLPVE